MSGRHIRGRGPQDVRGVTYEGQRSSGCQGCHIRGQRSSGSLGKVLWSAALSSFLGEKQSSSKGRKLQKGKDRSELAQIMVSELLWETSRQAGNEGLDYLIGQRKEE